MSLASLEDISRFNYEFNQYPDCQCTTRVALELNQEPFLIRIEGLESDEAAAIVTSTLDPITILLDLRKIKLVPILRNRIQIDFSNNRLFRVRIPSDHHLK